MQYTPIPIIGDYTYNDTFPTNGTTLLIANLTSLLINGTGCPLNMLV